MLLSRFSSRFLESPLQLSSNTLAGSYLLILDAGQLLFNIVHSGIAIRNSISVCIYNVFASFKLKSKRDLLEAFNGCSVYSIVI